MEDSDRLNALYEAALSRDPAALTPGMRALAVLVEFSAEVENGGFAACMYNATGDLTSAAIEAARRVGAEQHAAVIERFVRVALQGDPSMSADRREERLETWDSADPELETLDDAFYALPDIAGPLAAYIDAHPGEFPSDAPQPESGPSANYWAACPELEDDPAKIDALVEEVRGKLGRGEVRKIRIYLETYLSNAAPGTTVSRDALLAAALKDLSQYPWD